MTTQTAKDAYQERRNEIAALLDTIGQELDVHARLMAEEGSRNWGRVGDLGRVKELLVETLAFISGRTEADIHEYLDDLKG
jgi:hypothetical protein